MAYSFSDARGHLGAGPSVNGLRDIKQLIAEYKDWPRPALEQLIQYGHTSLLPALSMECNNLAKKTTDKEIKHSLTSLAALARKADEVIIMES